MDLLELFCASALISGTYPSSEGQWLFNSYVVLIKLELRRVGSDLGHRPSFLKVF
jgi:hypothetical protein